MPVTAIGMPPSPSDTVTIESAFGTLAIPTDALVRFVAPLWGFEGHPEFALLPGARRGVWWLISTGDTPATFVLADPFVANATYAIDLGEADKAALQLTEPADALALVMLAMPSAPEQPVTANFRAPLVFNVRERLAAQVVSRDESHGLQQPIDLTRYELVTAPA